MRLGANDSLSRTVLAQNSVFAANCIEMLTYSDGEKNPYRWNYRVPSVHFKKVNVEFIRPVSLHLRLKAIGWNIIALYS